MEATTTSSANPGSPLWHIPIAVGIQVALFLSVVYGGLPLILGFGIAGFIVTFMREITQYEYQYIQTHGGLRANLPAFEGLKFWKWNTHSKREELLAFIAVIVVSLGFIFI